MCKASNPLRPPHWQIVLYACLILGMSIVGIFCNLLSSFVLYKHYVFRNPFGRLTLTHAMANVGVLLIFAAWVVPLILADIDDDLQWINRQMGQLILFFQEIALHAIVFVSINRFSCICNPSLYRKFFTNKLTVGIIIFIFILCFMYYSSYYLRGCGIYFDPYYINWSFLDTPCGLFMAFYMDFMYNVSLFGVVACLDVSSLIMLRLNRQKFQSSIDQAAVKRRNARDMRFFVQAVINSVVYGFTLFTFDVLTCHVESITDVFFLGTFAWCSAHMISGIILVVFNREIRKAITSPTSAVKSTDVVEVSHASHNRNLHNHLAIEMCMATDLTPLEKWQSILLACLILSISLLGFFCNAVSSVVLYRHSVFKNSFGRFTLLHSTANIGVLTIFTFWAVPKTIIGIKCDCKWLNHQMGQLGLFFQEVAFHAILVISFNRLTCVLSPFFYNVWFTPKLTKRVIICIFIWCSVYYFSFYLEGCGFYFKTNQLAWTFANSTCGEFMGFYIDLSYNVVLFGIVAVFDISTLMLLRLNKKKFDHSLSESEAASRNARDFRFISQALASSIVYGLTLFTFDVVTCWVTTITKVFLAGTLAWCSAHAISGVILVLFNKEIREAITSPKSVIAWTGGTEVLFVQRGSNNTA